MDGFIKKFAVSYWLRNKKNVLFLQQSENNIDAGTITNPRCRNTLRDFQKANK